MKLKNPGNLVLAILMTTAMTMSSCTHQLKIKNLNTYYNTSLPALETPLRVGIRSSCTDVIDQQLVYGIGSSLAKYNARVTTAVNADNSNIDVVANISVLSDYKGSG